jgi:hypothetical protein
VGIGNEPLLYCMLAPFVIIEKNGPGRWGLAEVLMDGFGNVCGEGVVEVRLDKVVVEVVGQICTSVLAVSRVGSEDVL